MPGRRVMTLAHRPSALWAVGPNSRFAACPGCWTRPGTVEITPPVCSAAFFKGFGRIESPPWPSPRAAPREMPPAQPVGLGRTLPDVCPFGLGTFLCVERPATISCRQPRPPTNPTRPGWPAHTLRRYVSLFGSRAGALAFCRGRGLAAPDGFGAEAPILSKRLSIALVLAGGAKPAPESRPTPEAAAWAPGPQMTRSCRGARQRFRAPPPGG